MKKISSTLIIIALCLNILACEERKKGQYLEHGIALFDQGKYKESELEIKSAIQEDPSLAEPYYYLALLDEKGKKYKAMKANLLEAVKLNPEKNKVKLKLSKVLLLFNDLDGATKQIEEILAKDPEQLEAQAVKASILMRQQKNDEALVIIDNILKKDSEHIDALSLKVVMLIKKKSFDQALALLTPALLKDSENISLHLLKIQIDSQKN
ncbi:MAG: tetratricopeptide repeat protein, partial [Methylococcales bacterium]